MRYYDQVIFYQAAYMADTMHKSPLRKGAEGVVI